MRIAITFFEHPFHSCKMIPHIFEKTTFSAIRIQKERVRSAGEDRRMFLPSESPKNWLYHSPPAKMQNTRLLPHVLPLA